MIGFFTISFKPEPSLYYAQLFFISLHFQFFAFLYRLAGQSSDLTMVNSSWTEEHISALWGKPESLYKIYPPCDVTEFKMIKRKRYGDCPCFEI